MTTKLEQLKTLQESYESQVRYYQGKLERAKISTCKERERLEEERARDRLLLGEAIRKAAVKAWAEHGKPLDYMYCYQPKYYIYFSQYSASFDIIEEERRMLHLNTHYFPTRSSCLKCIKDNIVLLKSVHGKRFSK